MSTETKDKTQIQKAIKLVEVRINEIMPINSEPASVRRRGYEYIVSELTSLLPYEKQWAEEIFEAGSNWYEDNEDNLRYKLDNPLTDFKTLYSKYEK